MTLALNVLCYAVAVYLLAGGFGLGITTWTRIRRGMEPPFPRYDGFAVAYREALKVTLLWPGYWKRWDE